MAVFKCSVCAGTFHDPQPDGSVYFHACPPFSRAELLALPPATVVALIPSLPALFTPAQLDTALQTLTIERPGKRNENVLPGYTNPPIQPGSNAALPPAPMVSNAGARQ